MSNQLQNSYPEIIDIEGPPGTNSDISYRKPAKKRKSARDLLTEQYQKNFHILHKVTKKKDAGIIDERD